MVYILFEIHRDVLNLSCFSPSFEALGACYTRYELPQYNLIMPHWVTPSLTRFPRAGPERPVPGNIKNESDFEE